MSKIKVIAVLLLVALIGVMVAGCGSQTNQPQQPAAPSNQPAPTKLVVGATAKPHAEVLEQVKPILAKDGINLEIKVFTDYAQLNPALADKQLDANYFQHIPYLDDYNKNNGKNLVTLSRVHIEPMGIYSQKIKAIGELADKATVGIPNDATNGGRALKVLEAAGVIKLKDGVGILATPRDIVQNPKNIKIKELDAALLPRSLSTVDAAVINGNYAMEAKLNPVKDAIYLENKESPFVNVLVVRPEDKDKEALKKLGQALNSPEVKKYIEATYQGGVVPAF